MYFQDWEKKEPKDSDIVVWITKQLPYLDAEQWRRLRNELLLETKRRFTERMKKNGR